MGGKGRQKVKETRGRGEGFGEGRGEGERRGEEVEERRGIGGGVRVGGEREVEGG